MRALSDEKIRELSKIFKGLDHPSKYYVYLVLLDSREPLTIPRIQKMLREKFGIDMPYSNVNSLINTMQDAGLVVKIADNPKRVKLLKKVEVKIEDLD